MDLDRQPLIIRLLPANNFSDSSNNKEESGPLISKSHLDSETTEEKIIQTPIPDDFLSVATTPNFKLKRFKRNLDVTFNVHSTKRNFVKSWKRRFPFIEYDVKKKLMFCKICKQHSNERQNTAPFVCGTRNFRLSSIRCHENSVLHSKCLELSQSYNLINFSFGCGKDREKVLNALKSVYFIIKTKCPFTSFPQLCATQKKQCLEIGPAYISHHKVVPYFSKYIALILEKELSQKLKDLEYFSLVLDTSFSRAGECHELVYIKYIETNVVKTTFLGIIESKNASGETLYENLSKLFGKFGIEHWSHRVVHIMTHLLSNSSWLGQLTEIVKKNSSNFICLVPLLGHRVKHSTDIFKTHIPTRDFMNFILIIYQYYSKIPDYEKKLPNMERDLDTILKTYGGLPKNSCVTFNFNTLEAIKEDLNDLVELLKRNICSDFKKGKLKRKILSTITKRSFIMKLSLYLDVFSCLSTFANTFQDHEFMPFSVYPAVVGIREDLIRACNGKGEIYKQCLEDFSIRYPNSQSNQDEEMIIENMQSFLGILSSYFRNESNKLTLLKHAQVFDTRNWFYEDQNESIANFRECYSKLLNTEQNLQPTFSEWCIWKKKACLDFSSVCLSKPRTLILNMISKYHGDMPNLAKLLEKILLLDFSSPEMLKGYQEMNLVKSVDRSTLSVNSLQNSMMIIMHGLPLSKYDPMPAFELWLNQCRRRYHKRTKQRNIPCHEFLESLL